MRALKYIASICLTAIIFTVSVGQAADINLGRPEDISLNMNIVEALRMRRSVRKFRSMERIPESSLSALLWAAMGVNRENGKRTAPFARGAVFMNIYVVSDEGIYAYDAKSHVLKHISGVNAKAKMGRQDFVKTAPVILVLTADMSKYPGRFHEGKLPGAHATAGCIAENVYLIAPALNLGTCMVGSINLSGIKESIPLSEEEIPLYIMPVGYPDE